MFEQIKYAHVFALTHFYQSFFLSRETQGSSPRWSRNDSGQGPTLLENFGGDKHLLFATMLTQPH